VPRLVGKHQTRLAGLDDRVLDLYAGGMSVRDITAHLQVRILPLALSLVARCCVRQPWCVLQ
jgi:transposase-like protein